MIARASSAFRNGVILATDIARRFAWATVIGSLLLAVAAAVYFVSSFHMNTSTEDMLSPELRFRQLSRELEREFPTQSDVLLIVVEGRTPDLADDAATALAARLELRPDLFSHVFYPQGSAFFRENGLLYLDPERLTELSDRLAEAQPFLGALWRDPSLRGLFDMLALAATRRTDGGDGETTAAVEIAPILNQIATVAEAQAAGKPSQLSWQELISGGTKKAQTRRIIIVNPALNYGGLQPARAALNEVRTVIASLGLGEAGDDEDNPNVRVRLSGPIAISHDELTAVTVGMGLASTVSMCGVILLLVICFRSPRQTLSCLITLIVGLVYTAAFAVAAVGSLNLISVAFAVLFIGLGVDFGIHYGLRYREVRENLPDHAVGLREAAVSVGGALALTAVAAAISFFSFLPTDYVGFAELGLIAGTGMFIALACTLLLMPAMLTVVQPRFRQAVEWETTRRATFAPWVRRQAHWVVGGAIAVALAGLALTPWARFDFDPLHLKNPDSESVSTLLDLLRDDPTSAYAITVLADSVEDAAALAARAKALEPVHSTRTILSFIPKDQDEKLDIIDTMALFLDPSLSVPQEPAPSDAEIVDTYHSLRAKLRDLARTDRSETGRAAGRLARALDVIINQSAMKPEVLDDLKTRLLGGLPGRVLALRDSLRASPVTLENLPADLRDQWVAADGRARVDIYPRDNLYEDEAGIRRFVMAVRTITPDAAGTPVSIYAAGQAVIGAFIEAAIIAGVAISLLLLVLLRSIKDTLIVFAPIALAGIITVAIAVLIGMPFNFANVIVLPLLFGLGVAGSVHIVVRQRKLGGHGEALDTSTPRAVVFSALTTMASFGSLSLSHHPGTSSMGVLLAIAIGASLICTLLVLPAILALVPAAPGRVSRREPARLGADEGSAG